MRRLLVIAAVFILAGIAAQLSRNVTSPIILDYILPARAGVPLEPRATGAVALGMVATVVIFAIVASVCWQLIPTRFKN
jgi:hypothetical protein